MDEQKNFQHSKNLTNVSLAQGNVNIYMQGTTPSEISNSESYSWPSASSASSTTVQRNASISFADYIQKATGYYSMKKTLLYEHQPHSFYELYVCNNLSFYKAQTSEFHSENNGKHDKRNIRRDRRLYVRETISNATPERLEKEAQYIIIVGTGGIGKSMFVTHLFLSSAKDYVETGKLPILATLKDYRDKTQGIVDFAWKAVQAFDSEISKQNISDMLRNKKVLLMLDGLDELQSSLYEKFNSDLEDFIKAYAGNSVIITSRPTNSFVSYSSFSVFSIDPLTKSQAIQLVKKLKYWDEQAKSDFLRALERNLYRTHKEFASNPLLLTIMLMTYTTFGEVPAKMHVFYAKAYETMARLHDATKGSYRRPFLTNLTPEELAELFSEFCARTYWKEKVEFTSEEFASFMDKIISRSSFAKTRNVTSSNFLLDLERNLCIMYHEGNKHYFIHRSFQEYFAALYFVFDYDENLKKVGTFFENNSVDTYQDKTFDMLYDMIPEKVERYIFLPYLEELIEACERLGESEGYWEFLERLYPVLFYRYDVKGEANDAHDSNDAKSYEIYRRSYYRNEAKSFLYKAIIRYKNLQSQRDINSSLPWPIQVYDDISEDWLEQFRKIMRDNAKDDKARSLINHVVALNMELRFAFANERKHNSGQLRETQEPQEAQTDIKAISQRNFSTLSHDRHFYFFAIIINELRNNVLKYFEIRQFMESPNFPLMEEYNNVKKYYNELKYSTRKEQESDELFDD